MVAPDKGIQQTIEECPRIPNDIHARPEVIERMDDQPLTAKVFYHSQFFRYRKV